MRAVIGLGLLAACDRTPPTLALMVAHALPTSTEVRVGLCDGSDTELYDDIMAGGLYELIDPDAAGTIDVTCGQTPDELDVEPVAGASEFEVWAQYRDLSVTGETRSVSAPTVRVLLDGNPGAATAVWTAVSMPDDRPTWRLRTGVSSALVRSLTVEVDGAGSLEDVRVPVELAAPALKLMAVDCPLPCTLSARQGGLRVEVDVPRLLTGAVTLEQRVDEALTTVSTVSSALRPDGGRYAVSQLARPPDGSTWTFGARLDGVADADPLVVLLQGPPQIDLQADPPGAIRYLGDRDGCRELGVEVKAPELAGEEIELSVAGGARASVVDDGPYVMDAAGTARVAVGWEAAATSDRSVSVSVTGAWGASGSLAWTLEPTPAASATLIGSGIPILVGPTGSLTALTLRGQILPPEGSRLDAAPDWSLVVFGDPEPAPCARPLSADEIACDLDGVTSAGRVSCAMTPSVPSTDSQGIYRIDIPAGACFTGALTVQIWARTWDGVSDGCLYEGTIGGPQLLAERIVSFLPAP